MKTCSKCGETKPFNEFMERAESKDGHRGTCRACWRVQTAEGQARWRERHPEKSRQLAREYTEQNREKERERWRRYDEEHREERRLAIAKSRADNPEHHRALGREWAARNREKRRMQLRLYHERRRSGAPFSEALDEFIKQMLTEPCTYCGATARITMDHIVPLSRGGKHEADNLAPACLSCNVSKGAKLLDEWNSQAVPRVIPAVPALANTTSTVARSPIPPPHNGFS